MHKTWTMWWKYIFWPCYYTNIHYDLCPLRVTDTRSHLPSKCINHHVHGIHISRHNKPIYEMVCIFLSSNLTICFMVINASTRNNIPSDNTLSSWLPPYEWYYPRCTYSATLRPHILCILRTTKKTTPPFTSAPSLQICITDFTFYHNILPEDSIEVKMQKYNLFIDKLRTLGWQVRPLIILIVFVRGEIHTPTIK